MNNIQFDNISTSYSIDDYDNSVAVEFDEINPGLFLGNCFGAGKVLGKGDPSEKLQNLKNHNITHILCCTANKEHYFPNDIRYMFAPLNDTNDANLVPYLASSFEFIDNALQNKEGVLVHCSAGASRSASIVIAYLIKKSKFCYEEAYQFVKSKRLCVEPNPGFVRQLKEYESSLIIQE